METPTTVAAGVVLTLFGSALLLWCAVELRLRHHLRRNGVPATARVVGDRDPFGARHDDTFGELDSAPLLVYTAVRAGVGAAGRGTEGADRGERADHPPGPRPGPRELRCVEDDAESGEPVFARPRGHTPLRRPLRLVPGAFVQVSYDPRRPNRVVLAAHEDMPTMPADLFWSLLGTSALAGGLTLLTSVLSH